MFVRFYRPPSPLNEVVSCMVYYSGYVAPAAYELVFPSYQLQWVICLDESPRRTVEGAELVKLPNSWLQGATDTSITFEAEKDATTLSVLFQPGAIRRLLGCGAHELTGLFLDADDVFDRVSHLRSQLLATAEPDRIFEITAGFLLSRLVDAKTAAISQIAAARLSQKQTSVKNVAVELGYSHKQLIHIFKQNIGLAPKAFKRICRLHRLANNVAAGQSLLDAGLASGFYDHAHICNEFKAMLDLTPREYLAGRTEYPHVVAR